MSNFLEDLQQRLQNIIDDDSNNNSYTKSLINSGSEQITKKIIEEAYETCLASIESDGHKNGKEQLILESADLIYHLLILLMSKNIKIEEVLDELKNRQK
ncbi:phosphoribosyl-ATP diphosphatase [Rickettsiales bacterium]|nr:phosphoribosyl-ATP diphosphatase [Rickettsiales bacterium]